MATHRMTEGGTISILCPTYKWALSLYLIILMMNMVQELVWEQKAVMFH